MKNKVKSKVVLAAVTAADTFFSFSEKNFISVDKIKPGITGDAFEEWCLLYKVAIVFYYDQFEFIKNGNEYHVQLLEILSNENAKLALALEDITLFFNTNLLKLGTPEGTLHANVSDTLVGGWVLMNLYDETTITDLASAEKIGAGARYIALDLLK